MSRGGLDRLLSWMVVIILGIQVNHFLANRSADLNPPFVIAFYPDNGGLAVYFGALLSTVLIFPLLYLTRWRAAVVLDCGWAGKIFRPNMLELDETLPLGRSILRVLFFAGVILPMVGHIWLVHRWLKDPDIYIPICSVNKENSPLRYPAVMNLYPEVDSPNCRTKLAGKIGPNGIRHCIKSQSSYGPYCRIATDWKGHFVLVGSGSLWKRFRLGHEESLVSYFPVLIPGIGVVACAVLLFYWLDTLAMIFVPRIRCWLSRPA